MNRRFLKQNKAFLSIITILFIIIGSVLYSGGKLIYEKEAKYRHGNAVSQLLSAKENIKVFFADLEHDLFFLRNILRSKEYVNSNFKDLNDKNEIEGLFYELANVRRYYNQIGIIDSSGHEVIIIDNKQDGTTVIASETQLQNRKYKDSFHETMETDSEQVYVSSVYLGMEENEVQKQNFPTIELTICLLNSKNERKGFLVLNLYLKRLLKLLPENTFIQTEEGDLISLRADGAINLNKSHYDFSDSPGWIDISEDETIHYSDVEFLPGKKLVVAIFHKHPMLKATLQRLILVSIILLALFLCLILIIGYLNFMRFGESMRAQKAIIFSLAELAEYRDPETGQHLERTRMYSVVLAKQLRNHKKYRRIITSEFIDDLYDAAPLHDIGKVGIRDSILLKEGKLNEEEYEEMKKHVLIGRQVLQNAINKFQLRQSFIIMSRNLCAHHQEKYNGKGYPEGLKGEEIPLEARIFALCDAYDAIRSKRSYKGKLPHEEAVKRIKSDRGEHFDPDIVDSFLKCENEFAIKYVTFDNNQPLYV